MTTYKAATWWDLWGMYFYRLNENEADLWYAELTSKFKGLEGAEIAAAIRLLADDPNRPDNPKIGNLINRIYQQRHPKVSNAKRDQQMITLCQELERVDCDGELFDAAVKEARERLPLEVVNEALEVLEYRNKLRGGKG